MSKKQSGNDFVKRRVLSRRQNVDSDSADITSSGRSFQICGPTTEKDRLPTVDSLTGGTSRRLAPTQRRIGGQASRREKTKVVVWRLSTQNSAC